MTGSPSAAFGLLFLIYGIWFFAFIGSLTAASRATWAFARDGGIPASSLWKKVNARTQVPINALLLSAVVNALLGLIYLGSSAAFNAFTGVATICLGASYGFPILCSVIRKRAPVKDAAFSLGKFGMAIVSTPWSRLSQPEITLDLHRISWPSSGLPFQSFCSACRQQKK